MYFIIYYLNIVTKYLIWTFCFFIAFKISYYINYKFTYFSNHIYINKKNYYNLVIKVVLFDFFFIAYNYTNK